MAQHKKILITLPDSLLDEVDSYVKRENINRSELVREAMKLYIKERKKMQLKEEMKKGYLEMAGLNLNLANECLEVDNETFRSYEEKLLECE